MVIELTFGKSAVDKIEALKVAFGVTTDAQVVSKAIELARIVADHADSENTVLLESKDGTPIRVHLAG
jgi:hypothetical protein